MEYGFFGEDNSALATHTNSSEFRGEVDREVRESTDFRRKRLFELLVLTTSCRSRICCFSLVTLNNRKGVIDLIKKKDLEIIFRVSGSDTSGSDS